MHSFVVSVIISTPKGIVCVRDPKKPAPQYWKFPGGRSEAGEAPEAAARREAKEETGLTLTELTLLHEETRGSGDSLHTFYAFTTTVSDLTELQEKAVTGEDVALFPLDALEAMPDFFPPHRSLLLQYKKDAG